MGAKESKIIRSIADSIKRADDRKTSAYDTQATIRRIEGNTAWVHIPGGVDETPVQLTINASEGDTVQVRVSGGRAFLVGNASAPPTDNAYARQVNRTLTQEIQTTNTVLGGVKKVVQTVKKIADNTNQYFWHTETGTDTGAHITEIPQEDFLADPENGGGNLLARSNGIAVRDGLDELARFSASETQIGADDDKNIQIDQSSVRFNDGTDQIAGIYSFDETEQTTNTTGTDFALLGEYNPENETWETPHRVILSGKHYQNLSDDSFEDIGVLEVVANNEQDSSKSTSARVEALAFNDGQVSIWMRLKRGSTEKSFSIDVNDTQQIIQTDISRIRILNESDPVNGQINFNNGNITARNIGVPQSLADPSITKTAGGSTCSVIAFSGYGKTRMLILAFTTTAAISSGSNVFTGTVTTTNARPMIAAGGSGFAGGTAVIGNINASGGITIRACGGSIGSGSTIWVYFTYFVA